MKKTYLFDLYGTLIDLHSNETKATLWRSLAGIYSMQGAAYDARELKEKFSEYRKEQVASNLEKMKKKYNDPDMKEEEIEVDLDITFRQLYEDKGVKVSDEIISLTAIAFRSISMSYIKLFDGVPELLDRLHSDGCKIYLLSNAQASFTIPEVEMFGLDKMFDGLFYSSDIGVKKPSKYFYDALVSAYSLDKKDCVMVGNEYGNDVMGAYNYGIDSIYVNTVHSKCGGSGPLPDNCREIHDIREVYV